MPQKFTDREYFQGLPKKQVGTAVLLFNGNGELLIIKPNYKASWLVPGGSNDENESPLECALRETREEIGLDISEIKLVGVYHSLKKGLYPDSLKFIFFGGILTDSQVSEIKIQDEEITDYAFKDPLDAIPLLSSSLKNSVPDCLEAIRENAFVYFDEPTA